MSRSVDLLVKRGWVERRAAPHDRRQVLLALTEQGIAAHNAMTLQSRALVAGLIGRLEQAEQLQLYGGLVALNRLFSHTNPCRTEQEQN
jgi:DNA-binding MarR family transcriptional regulator